MLMQVYAESNCLNGGEKYPNLPENLGILQAEQDFYSYLQEVFFATPDALYAVWVENGRYVCALRLEPYRDGLLLEALETAPNERRKGYATVLIRAVLEHPAIEKGMPIYSHVSRANTASLRIHEICGFRKSLDYAVYIDDSVNRKSVTLVHSCNKKTGCS